MKRLLITIAATVIVVSSVPLAAAAGSPGSRYRALANVTIRWEPCPERPEVEGCVFLDDPSVVYVREHGNTDSLHHELGHVWDLRTLTDADRDWFRPLLGYRRAVPWFGPARPGRPEGDFPAERFADAAALCIERLRVRRYGEAWMFASQYTPTVWRQKRICTAISVLDLVRHSA